MQVEIFDGHTLLIHGNFSSRGICADDITLSTISPIRELRTYYLLKKLEFLTTALPTVFPFICFIYLFSEFKYKKTYNLVVTSC